LLNAVLFLLLGLEAFAVPAGIAVAGAALLVIPAVVAARFVSVALPVLVLRRRRTSIRGVIPILTWSGLRGGFTIVVQGLMGRRLLAHYRVSAAQT
jgi:CPA1 family monovalent cation:H+ antiporter